MSNNFDEPKCWPIHTLIWPTWSKKDLTDYGRALVNLREAFDLRRTEPHLASIRLTEAQENTRRAGSSMEEVAKGVAISDADLKWLPHEIRQNMKIENDAQEAMLDIDYAAEQAMKKLGLLDLDR